MVRIGSRGSELALWQANYVAGLLGKENCEIIVIKTQGDIIQNVSFNKMEGKGFFTKEIEESLLKDEIDIAVHSMKDLPVDDCPGLTIGAVLPRENPADILLFNKDVNVEENFRNLDNLTIGTSSLRRAAQVKNLCKGIIIKPLRGNVPTRIKKLLSGDYDAIILALAGLKRLNIKNNDLKSYILNVSEFLPAPAQGALAVQCRESDSKIIGLLSPLLCVKTLKEVNAEREFLRAFGGGCHVPVGAYAQSSDNLIKLYGSITSPDGSISIKESVEARDSLTAGIKLADAVKSRGAMDLF